MRSVGLGYDEGTVLIKIGREEPVASMDTSGKIIWARHNEVQTVNVKSLGQDFEEVGATSICPHTVPLLFCLRPCRSAALMRWSAPPVYMLLLPAPTALPMRCSPWMICVLPVAGELVQADGERLPLVVKDLGSCDMYPASLVRSLSAADALLCIRQCRAYRRMARGYRWW